MKKTERVRQLVSAPPTDEDLKHQTDKGWKLVAIEWEREVETSESQLPSQVPFGLRIEPETQSLEENPEEREILVQLMELLVQEGSYARIADALGCSEVTVRSHMHHGLANLRRLLQPMFDVPDSRIAP